MKINFVKPIEINERYNHYPGPFAIDEESLVKIFPDIKNIEITPYSDGIYSFQKGDLEEQNLKFILKLVKYLQPKTILEVGTFRGRTTYHMAVQSPHSSVITIDIANLSTYVFSGTDVKYYQPSKDVGRAFKDTTVENRIKQVISDSLSKECYKHVEDWLGGKKIDFAFIDAGHDFDSVRHNFEELVLPLLSKDGVVVFDDYNRPLSILGVSHYLLEKAYKDGYVFYWYAPKNSAWTNEVIFLNSPEARCYNWRKFDE